jgi:hypothetical protein
MDKKFADPHTYAALLGQYLTNIEEVSRRVAPFYDQLTKAMNSNSLAEMSDKNYDDIRREFLRAAISYGEIASTLKKMDTPVIFKGMHELLTKDFDTYQSATQKMSDSLNPGKTVNFAKFSESDKEQDDSIAQFKIQIRKIMRKQI